jgi:2Fe-2S ferredoxin
MARVTYVEADGTSKTVEVPDGWSLMQGAVANGVKGILGICGGSCSCGTCHSYVDEARDGELPPRSIEESNVLDTVAAELRPNSRLACQIISSPKVDGLVLNLPSRQE